MAEIAIESLQVGLPRTLGLEGAPEPMDRPWTTGFFKAPVAGPVWLGAEGLEGDGVADRRVHGGPEKAVLVYGAPHYPAWEHELGLVLPPGAFGENFTVSGQTEAEVCLGDIYAVGEALVEVAQPRQPCWKLSRRWRVPDLAVRVQASGRTGWYLRVHREGRVAAGDRLILLDRPHPEWTVAEANAVMHARGEDRAAAALAACPALAPGWRKTLEARAATGAPTDTRPRLMGPNEPS
ncbi:MAG: MOSC domain-containing protein [Candidatus Sericytochromatia bacterium]